MKGRPILLVRLSVALEKEEEFTNWYQNEYIPRFMKQIPGLVSCRRYVSKELEPRQYLTIYEFESEEAIPVAMQAIASESRDKDRQEWKGWEKSYLIDFADATYNQIYSYP